MKKLPEPLAEHTITTESKPCSTLFKRKPALPYRARKPVSAETAKGCGKATK